MRNSEIYVIFRCERVQNDRILHVQNSGKNKTECFRGCRFINDNIFGKIVQLLHVSLCKHLINYKT